MTRIAIACLLLLVSCALDEPATPGITRACYRSFAPTLDAWQATLLRVPAECSLLDQVYTVQLVSAGELVACPMEPGGTTVGCTHGDTIYLLAGRDDVATTDSSVHEWIHALAQCTSGDPDRDHTRAKLWAEYGPSSVEIQALASVTPGECL